METEEYKLIEEVKGYCLVMKYITIKRYGFLWLKKKEVEHWGYLDKDFLLSSTLTVDGEYVDSNPVKYYDDKKVALKHLNRLKAGSVIIAR
jgi:hypothetical protein